MMYNPYNWKIKEECDPSDVKCVLDRLTSTYTELDMTRLENQELRNKLEESDKKIMRLEDEKLSLIKELAEHP